jgi:hypothetical protein
MEENKIDIVKVTGQIIYEIDRWRGEEIRFFEGIRFTFDFVPDGKKIITFYTTSAKNIYNEIEQLSKGHEHIYELDLSNSIRSDGKCIYFRTNKFICDNETNNCSFDIDVPLEICQKAFEDIMHDLKWFLK